MRKMQSLSTKRAVLVDTEGKKQCLSTEMADLVDAEGEMSFPEKS